MDHRNVLKSIRREVGEAMVSDSSNFIEQL